MSQRPTKCKVPDNVWFSTRTQALNNLARKGHERTWHVWKCFDHFHIQPNKKTKVKPPQPLTTFTQDPLVQLGLAKDIAIKLIRMYPSHIVLVEPLQPKEGEPSYVTAEDPATGSKMLISLTVDLNWNPQEETR